MELTLPKILPNELLNVPIIDLRGKLPVNKKYTWESLKGVRDPSSVTTIVFHHDALSKARTAAYTDEQLIQRISTAHISSKNNIPGGDPGFPYHGFVRNGRLYICNDLLTFTYGVARNNTFTAHIAVSGNYAADDVLTDADRNALYAGYYLFKGNMPAFKELKGHGELNPSSCPGYSMSKVRADLMAIDQEIERNNSPEKQLEIAMRMSNQLLYFNRMASEGIDSYGKPVTDGQREWALQQLLLLREPFEKLGWLK